MKPLTFRRDGVVAAAGFVGSAASWSLFVGLAVAVLADVVADGSPPSLGYLFLAAAVVLTAFWLISVYTWLAVVGTRLLVAVRRASSEPAEG